MKNQLLKALTPTVLALSLVLTPALALADSINNSAEGNDTQTCYSMVLTSGTGTQTAGYTEVAQAGAATALMAASYSNASFGNSSATETVIPPWVDPATDGSYMSSGAMWVSTHSSWPGGSGNTEGSTTASQWRLFHDSFTLPADAIISSATLSYSADNAAAVYQNGSTTPVSAHNDVYGMPSDTSMQNFASVTTAPLTVMTGTTTLDFVVRNWASADAATNPTGLVYKAVINYCRPIVAPPQTVTVHINKFIDGVQATTTNANSKSFPMNASWDDEGGIGSSTGAYTLDNTNNYQTATIALQKGAEYATNEVTTGDIVGATCSTTPFALMGYTTGHTLAQAAAATPTMAAPNFHNLTYNKYVIVWNHDCANTSSSGTIGGNVSGGTSGTGVLAVTSVTPTDTEGTADNTYENGMIYTFNITVPTNEQNLKMKFSDWVNVSPASTIAAGGNMRISSLQADNGNATVPVAAANVYSTPALHITGDLNPAMAGMQVQVKVEFKIPVGSTNGAYTTSYGVQTLP